MKYFISGVAIISFSLLSVFPLQASLQDEPNNLPLCYMIIRGRLFNLNSLCIQGAINNYYQQLDKLRGFNYSQYLALKNGMKYAQVAEILGTEGTEQLRQTLGDIEKTQYIWRNSNGSNIRAVFNDGELVSKDQSRLQ